MTTAHDERGKQFVTDAELDRFEAIAMPMYQLARETAGASKYLVSNLCQWIVRLVAEVRRLRRSEVPAPSAERRDLTPCGNLICTGCRVCGCPPLGITPQGEPSDAEVQGEPSDADLGQAAWEAVHDHGAFRRDFPDAEYFQAVGAAVRAAGGAR